MLHQFIHYNNVHLNYLKDDLRSSEFVYILTLYRHLLKRNCTFSTIKCFYFIILTLSHHMCDGIGNVRILILSIFLEHLDIIDLFICVFI
jgi:hypothetical protein